MADRSTKDKEMASHLKRMGVTRTQCRCPMCHKAISLNHLTAHLSACGRQRNEEID